MPRANKGTLIQCDSSIKAIIVKINAEHQNDIIIEDIDDEHVLIKTEKHPQLKRLLEEALRAAVKEAEESEESD